MQNPNEIRREMGISHKELFRGIPAAVPSGKYSIDDSGITIQEGDGQVRILYSEEQQRRLGILTLPFTTLSFSFSGLSELEIQHFMHKFDLSFRRGGG